MKLRGYYAVVLGLLLLALGLASGCSRSRLYPADLEGAQAAPDAGPDGQQDQRERPADDTQRLVFETVDKVDLVFVIDNSLSMGDKQELLRDAVPNLLERLINPPCISRDDRNDVVEVDVPKRRVRRATSRSSSRSSTCTSA